MVTMPVNATGTLAGTTVLAADQSGAAETVYVNARTTGGRPDDSSANLTMTC